MPKRNRPVLPGFTERAAADFVASLRVLLDEERSGTLLADVAEEAGAGLLHGYTSLDVELILRAVLARAVNSERNPA